jgi:pyruvate/2-oxoglutarate dehydrogenase complex dihydrolipoamide dehydrogenase (E3) component
MPRFDIAVIGAGAGGLSVTYAAARLGLRVALIERGAMGGECLNAGCVPSKTLLAAARRGLDWGQAQAAIRRAIAAIAPADSAERYTGLGATVLQGTARFTGRREIDVAGQAISARRIVVATGSRPKIPDFLATLPFLTNETIWDIPDLPGRLLILGGGPMAMEMADAFSRLGAAVTVIGGARYLAREDPELAAPVLAALRSRGVTMLPRRAVGARIAGTLTLDNGDEIAGDRILLATGRVVDTASLNLAAAGISAGPQGIRTDVRLRAIGNKNILVVGDAADPAGIGPQRFTHVAGAQAGLVVRQAIFRLPAKLSAAPPVRVTYTSPELAQVGLTLAEAGPGARALTWPFAENDRAIAEAGTAGLVKLVIDRKERLVGAGIAGAGAGEMIGLYALALAEGTKLSALAGLVLPYPTRSEAGKRAVGALFAEKLFAPGPRRLAKFLARLP